MRTIFGALAVSMLATGGIIGTATTANAGEFDTLGQIQIFGTTFCPFGTLEADGQLLNIKKHTTLYSLFGTLYGGDGSTTFALPDLRGRAPIGHGQGPGLSNYQIGEKGGTEANILQGNQLPRHSHTLHASSTKGSNPDPTDALPANAGRGQIYSASGAAPDVEMSKSAIGPYGDTQPQPVNNMQPFLVMRYCIVSDGDYPRRP